ncbi:NAD(+)/NADH kinase [Necator americanus]|uniref:NAD(+) kinase n=1 Tax=Necator americanus TaxID=51031 RepID=W2TH50_NECAM|nr:NAD(+)/NADH kinase [Necator americanus]ETN80327.1 NAD(+)/NADH kinase [Necator americanus]
MTAAVKIHPVIITIPEAEVPSVSNPVPVSIIDLIDTHLLHSTLKAQSLRLFLNRDMVMREANIITQVVTRQSLQAAIPWADLVVSAGGDGTFLTAAAAVADKTPVIGINTDPVGSEGHLCIGGKNPPHDLFQRIAEGKFQFANRNRIRVTVLNKKQEAKNDCILALNEVFVGEDEAAKVSTYSISIDDQPMVKQKSSGLIVSTGTGSTSWYYGMNRVEEQTVSAILEAMQNMGVEVKANVRGLAEEIAKKMNDKIAFEPDHPNFAYSIREPIFNATFKCTSVRGFARRIRLKSKCSKGFLVLDGATKIPFNSGTEVLLEIFEADALRTIKL